MSVKLTPGAVAALKPAATVTTVHDALITGLGLTVTPSGVKTWSVRYRIGRRLRRLTLGRYPVLGLADARSHAKNALKQVAAGIDPAQQKQDRRAADTIGEFAQTYVEKHAKRNKRSWKEDDRILRREILPKWRHHALREITRQDVRELLDEITARPAPVLANRVRSLLSKFYEVAIDHDKAEANPVKAVKRKNKEQQRARVLTHDEIRTLWAALDALDDSAMAALYRLRLITAQRGGEVATMRWQDVDLNTGWWTIPTERSKNKLPHRVPLSPSAVKLIKGLRAEVGQVVAARRAVGKDVAEPIYVLDGARGKRQQAAAAATFGIPDFRGHDLRRTAASLMAGGGVDRLVVSKILNHVETGVTAIYDRHSYDAEKQAALAWWDRKLAAILDTKDGAVVPFRRKKA